LLLVIGIAILGMRRELTLMVTEEVVVAISPS
jgi:hypothetical protein